MKLLDPLGAAGKLSNHDAGNGSAHHTGAHAGNCNRVSPCEQCARRNSGEKSNGHRPADTGNIGVDRDREWWKVRSSRNSNPVREGRNSEQYQPLGTLVTAWLGVIAD